MALIERINDEIKDAMRKKEALRLETLRMLKSKILAADARGNLSDPEVLKLFKSYLGNLQEALAQAVSANRPEMVSKLECEIVIVKEFLPKAPSLEETKEIVKAAIQESGAKSKKEFGLVMKAVMKLNSQVDGKLAKEIANQFLTD
jgi:hypothetical protein